MGSEIRVAHQKLYINVMELLVVEEVDRQLKGLPERVLKYVKRAEVETFALNRLPALYASSEKGLECQRDRAHREYKGQIQSAVRQALAAVQVDPIRLSQPLLIDKGEEAVLQALRELLKSPTLTWKTALVELQKLQRRRQRGPAAPPPPTSEMVSAEAKRMTSVPSPPPDAANHTTTWRPGTYGSRIGWKPRQPYASGGFEDTPQR